MFIKNMRYLNSIRTLSNATTVDLSEINQFQKFTSDWWDHYGPMKALHSMNRLRVPFVRDGLINSGYTKTFSNSPTPLKDVNILDVGCGGGILSESLSRLGAKVTGLDANCSIVEVAKSHAKENNLDINYLNTSVDEHCSNNQEKYDAIVASEIVEHVTKKEEFLEACVKCLKPNGSIFITTISKTTLANVLGICIAENVLNLLPKGTHQFEKFIEPHKLQRLLEDQNCKTELIHGMVYNLFTNKWHWCSDTSINYGLQATKLKE